MGDPDPMAGAWNIPGSRPDSADFARTLSAGAYALPPLRFHSIHGRSISVSDDGIVAYQTHAERNEAEAFSARPVRVNEKVYLRIINTVECMPGVRFGFTSQDPATLSQPVSPSPNKVRLASLDVDSQDEIMIMYYYVNSAGDVHFCVNGEHKGIFRPKVDTALPLWAVVAIDSAHTMVQFAEPRKRNQISIRDRMIGETRICSVKDPLPRYQNPLAPLSLHCAKGKNIRFSSENPSKIKGTFCQGYVFSAQPILPGQTIVIQIYLVEPGYTGSLVYGFTSCDPETLRPHHLPADAQHLLERPEYWVVRTHAIGGLCRGDELTVTLKLDGGVQESRNDSDPTSVLHVDHTQRLWTFVDLYGATRKVRILISQIPQQLTVVGGSQPERLVHLETAGAGDNGAMINRAAEENGTSLSTARRDIVEIPRSVKEERIPNQMSLSNRADADHIKDPLPQLTYQNPIPLSLHKTTRKNALINDDGIVVKMDNCYPGSVFTAHPVRPGHTIIIQILLIDSPYVGNLAIGFTFCDPAKLRPRDLPVQAEQLSDRPDYWVVHRHTASSLHKGDELAFTLSSDGDVCESRNNTSPVIVLHVNHTQRLWAFVDLFDATRSVRLLIAQTVQSLPRPRSSTCGGVRASTSATGYEVGVTTITTRRDVIPTTSVDHLDVSTTPSAARQDINAATTRDRQDVSATSSRASRDVSHTTSTTHRDNCVTSKRALRDVSPTTSMAHRDDRARLSRASRDVSPTTKTGHQDDSATSSRARRDVSSTTSAAHQDFTSAAPSAARRNDSTTTSTGRRNDSATTSSAGLDNVDKFIRRLYYTYRDVSATTSTTHRDVSATTSAAGRQADATTSAAQQDVRKKKHTPRRDIREVITSTVPTIQATTGMIDPKAPNLVTEPNLSPIGEDEMINERRTIENSLKRTESLFPLNPQRVGFKRRKVDSPSSTTRRDLSATTSVKGRDVNETRNVARPDVSDTSSSTLQDVNATITTRRDLTATTTSATGQDVSAIPSTSVSAPPRTDSTIELPPLTFHSVHGSRLGITSDGSVAQRTRCDFYEGEAYSARPVGINEKVRFCVLDISDSWKAAVHFGFTSHDPSTLARSTPADSGKYWVLSLNKRFCVVNTVMYYYVNAAGDVYFGVNGEDKSLFFSGVDTTTPLWALVNIDGECTTIQFMDTCHLDQRSNQFEKQWMINEMRHFSLTETPLPQLKYQDPCLRQLNIHTTTGTNVQYSSGVVAKIDGEYCQGYVFSARPMPLGETLVIQILLTELNCVGSIVYGVTSCDPATLTPSDLPDYADQLLDRREYWVIQHASNLRRGDELAVTLTLNGTIKERRNNSEPVTVTHVRHALKLWAFVDLSEATKKVRLMISETAQTPPQRAQESAESERLDRPSTSQHQNNRYVDGSRVRESGDPPAPSSGQDRPDSECTVCFDKSVDSVLDKCGHMCMCYMCALQVWKDGGGRCPICRGRIKKVIRIYKA